MYKYNKHSKCPKCWDDVIISTYVPSTPVKLFPNLIVPEHVLRRCCTCNHEWPEAPLDVPGTDYAPEPDPELEQDPA